MDILDATSKYLHGLNSNENKNLISTRLKAEFDLWKSSTPDIIDSGMSLYLSCDENIFPSINRCLQLLISLSVSVATSEKFLASKEDKNLATLHYITRAISGFSSFVYA
ncbi:unnamed protein product [Acanthoscelides obtectus]|uniref:Uncharacterized protein n=1 Tax=Acanthoscelides obtectus TaxID=200917 RepID=A0A9P0K282_ACAOB|nr:unnamed protein product [Acanthoscelides obtectus]CAK1669915.1 hypothetical protein AOBTE_LOCUS27304 [Acanthoscelides obtectus]